MSGKTLKTKTPKPLWNMSKQKDVENFLDELQGKISNDQTLTKGLILFLSEIENSRNHIYAKDFVYRAIIHLFSWTVEHDSAMEIYLENLRGEK